MLGSEAAPLSSVSNHQQLQQMELPIRIHFKRAPLLLTTTALVVATTALMYLCAHDGVRVESFEATTKDAHARKQLLDAYNSYSGNAVSLLIKPLEMFLAMVVAVSLLCFFTAFSTGNHGAGNARYNHVLLLSSAVTGYLLTNGFNALNAQLAPRPIESVITAQDLSLNAAESSAVDSRLSEYTGPERTPFMKPSDTRFLEEQDGNPLTNTILRNVLIPIALNPSPQCTLSGVTATVEARRDGAIASYGFPFHPWHQHALTTALRPTRSLKIAVTDNSTKAPKVISSNGLSGDSGAEDLPMDTQQAIKLLVQSIAMAQMMLPWWEDSYLAELFEEKIKAEFEPTLVLKDTDTTADTSRSVAVSDLLFGNADSTRIPPDELLTQAKKILFNFISKAPNASASEVQVEFTSITNISKGITFDSLTIEIPLRKDHFQREYYFEEAIGGFTYRTVNTSASSSSSSSKKKVTNESYYYELDLENDCSRDACLIKEPEYTHLGDESYTEPQVHALAVCVDERGSEDPLVHFDYVNMSFEFHPMRLYSGLHCVKNSNTSMYSVSVGKRIQGDEMTTQVLQHKDSFKDLRVLRLKNARKVYSITVTHISWELQELTKKYGAQCLDGGGTSSCRGLWYELDRPPNRQHLVVGANRLPLALLSAYNPLHKSMSEVHASTRLMPLVSKLMRRPASAYNFLLQTAPLYDLVYPRRFGKSDWPTKVDATTNNCSAAAEDFVHYAESNHLYMEQTLQPSYTAGFFFLLQDAVVRDVLTQDSSSIDSETISSVVVLDFAGNVQWIDVNVSSPMPNIILTLVGAAMLLVTSVVICIFGGKAKEAQLQRAMSAHNVAELLIADKKYPPMLVGMSITTGAALSKGGDDGANDGGTQDSKQWQIDLPATPSTTETTKSTKASLECYRIQSLTLVHHESSQQVKFPSVSIKQTAYV